MKLYGFPTLGSRKSSKGAIVAALLCIGVILAARPQGSVGDLSKLQVVATLQESAESLVEMADGSILVTYNAAGALMQVKPDGQVSEFKKLPTHPVVAIAIENGYLLTANSHPTNGRAGTLPPAASSEPPQNPYANAGTEVLLLDKEGNIVKSFPGKSGQRFNGITQAGKIFLIADCIGDTIYKLDIEKGTIEPWLKDENLAPAPGRLIPGANGIKAHDGWVYVSNTTRATMYRVRIDSKGRPKGSLTLYTPIPDPDDFDLTKDGTIYAPSAQSFVKIAPGGQLTKLFDPAQNGAAALVTHDQHWVYWGTRGPVPGSPSGEKATFLLQRYPLM